ncbi:MAG: hypothetical protein O2898_10665 [Proteobacteria bacterium]|nr:hypothetical protein [Pseudomonadota bacterium]
MSRTERLINLMKMREAMRAQRQAGAVGELSGEISRAQSMQDKLAQLIAVNTPLDEPMTPFALRSRAWYGRQMQEQLELLENRSGFLATELTQARAALQRHKTRETLLEERRVLARQTEIESRESRAEAQMPPRGHRSKD